MDHAARIRTGTLPAHPQAGAADPRISTDLAHLTALERAARSLRFTPRQPARSVLNGRHASRMRGRGLNFEELRDYLPSDDVRSIDWKVTARTGKPHVRVFTEERDRPALIVVDQRMSMFFGSVQSTKSAVAAECAAMAAFAVLAQGDRVGGIVFGDDALAEVRPKRSRAALNRFLTALAAANSLLRADAPAIPAMPLNDVLRAVMRIAPRNHLVLVFSDFDEIDETTARLISSLSRRNDLVLGLVTDPFARKLPPELRMVVSDGQLQAEINATDATMRRKLTELSEGRLAVILDWQRRFGVPVLPITAAEDAASQMRRLMGLGARR